MTFNGGERVRVKELDGGKDIDLIVLSPHYTQLLFGMYPNTNATYQGIDVVDGNCFPFSSGDVIRWQDKPRDIS
jgi:hypothetical protein